MSKINEYPQAVTINNNDLFVIDQESGGDHATQSASVSQIADKATSGVQSLIGSLSTLTTSVTSSLVGAVNEVNGAKTNVFKGKITIGTVSAGKKYDLFTLTNFTGGLVPDFATMKGLMYLGGGGNSNSYGYLFCNPITNLISYIPQVSDTNVSIYIAVLY